jgi:UDP-glucose 4-epimerase
MAAPERTPTPGRVIGMAQRPFEPTRHGWTKVKYLQSDILEDRDQRPAVDGAHPAELYASRL